MFSFKKKNKATHQLCAMISGIPLMLEDVEDEVFSKKMMGEGFAILPDSDIVCAPCDGNIRVIMEASGHAIGIENHDGMEILLHVGLDTINLQGQGFTLLCQLHDQVTLGTPLIRIDRNFLKEQNCSDITMLVVTNDNHHFLSEPWMLEHVQVGEPIIAYDI